MENPSKVKNWLAGGHFVMQWYDTLDDDMETYLIQAEEDYDSYLSNCEDWLLSHISKNIVRQRERKENYVGQ